MRFVSLCVSLGLLLPAAAMAQGQEPSDEAARRELIARGDEARRDGDHTRALDLYDQAARLRMTPSLRQMIAYEHHTLDHSQEAFDHASRCLEEAAVDREIRERERIVETCTAIVRRYEGRVQRSIARTPDPPPVAPPPSPTPAPPPRALPPPIATVRGPGAGPWILTGGGALAFGAAAVFAVLREDARTDRDAACPNDDCLPVANQHNARFEDFTVATDIALGVGAGAVAGGVLWYILGRSRVTSAPRVTVGTLRAGTGLTFRGVF